MGTSTPRPDSSLADSEAGDSMEVNQVILPVSEQEKDFEVHLSEVCLPLNLMSAHFAACSPACSVTPGGLCSSAMGCCADVTCTY